MQAKNYIFPFHKNENIMKTCERIIDIITNIILTFKTKKNKKIFSENELNMAVKVLNELQTNLINIYNDNEISDEIINNIEIIINKLSIIVTTFGCDTLESLLFLIWNDNYDTSSNKYITAKIKLLLKHFIPISCIIHKNDNIKISQVLCSDKLIDTITKNINQNNFECIPITDSNVFHLEVTGSLLVIHNSLLKQTLVIKGYINIIDIHNVNNNYINYYKKEYYNYFKDSEENIKNIAYKYIDNFILSDILIYSINDYDKKIISIQNQVNILKKTKIQNTLEKFKELSLYGKRTMLLNLLLYGKENIVFFIANLLYEFLSLNSDNTHNFIDNINETLTWNIKELIKNGTKNTIQFNNDMRKKYDNSSITLEQQIYLLQVNDNTKEKALAKLKEVKSKNDDSNSKAKQYLEGLVKIPFNIFKEEEVLTIVKTNNTILNKILTLFNNIHIFNNIPLKSHYTNFEICKIMNCIDKDIYNEYVKVLNPHINNLKTEELKKIIQKYNRNSENKMIINKTKSERIATIHKNIVNNINLINIVEEYSDDNKYLNTIISDISKIKSNNFKLNTCLDKIENNLNSCVYGHNNAKTQIFKVIAKWINGNQQGYCFGFEGSPGLGKTTLAKKGISNCLIDDEGKSRPFSFIALGGSSNGSLLEGHGYTYVNSNWGKIVDVLMESKCMNPIIYIDELDKVSGTEQGKEIIGILTHLIDKSQNNCFQDRYFTGIDIDLSRVLFVFSYNDPNKIDSILLDRIHRIKFDNLSVEDKIIITKDYIIPELNEELGLNNIVVINNDTIEYIIETYTIEAGVRKLKEIFFDIYGEINIELLKNNYDNDLPIILDINTLETKYLKKYNKIITKTINSNSEIGTINGLWANNQGRGGIIPIQTTFFPSNTFLELKLTGLQGDVMKESMNVAKTLAWNLTSKKMKHKILKQFEETKCQGIHIHCPDGSISKDGPSAGSAITTALYSLFNNKELSNTCALTGEITLSGSVTAIGGLNEKIQGGLKAGVNTFIIPKENVDDFEKIKLKYETKNINIYDCANFHFVKHIEEILHILKIH